MEEIIAPVDRGLLKEELLGKHFLRHTNRAGNELYSFTALEAPSVMREIGRLREIAFRTAGGGTGKALDIDHYDEDANNPYHQLIVWDPENEEILGGYRYHICDSSYADAQGNVHFATSELFDFSETFIKDYLPYTIELGRSFVQPSFQSTNAARKSIYALDNLWDGLGALVVKHSNHKYFLGKVTMYKSYNEEARNLLLYFLNKYFSSKEVLLTPKVDLALPLNIDEGAMAKIFVGDSYADDYKVLSQQIRMLGENIPPLINSYMNLSPSMRVFGTANNPYFGGVEETGLMVTIPDIYSDKVKRHVDSYRASC